MMSFEEIDGLQSKVEIVVNRAGLESGQISLKKAKETLGRDVYALLPNDYRTMVEVRNNGVPLINQAPKAAITQAMRDLAGKLQGEEVIAEGEEGKQVERKQVEDVLARRQVIVTQSLRSPSMVARLSGPRCFHRCADGSRSRRSSLVRLRRLFR